MLVVAPVSISLKLSPEYIVISIFSPLVVLFLVYHLTLLWVKSQIDSSNKGNYVAFVLKSHYLGGNDIVWKSTFASKNSAKIACQIVAYWKDHLGFISSNFGISYGVVSRDKFKEIAPSYDL